MAEKHELARLENNEENNRGALKTICSCAKCVLETDASDLGYGGVLYVCERRGDIDHGHSSDCLIPVCYNSGNFSEVQTRYSAN